MKHYKFLTALLGATALACPALAADLAVKAPIYKAPAPAYVAEWGGFYIGAHGGYGWGDTDTSDTDLTGPSYDYSYKYWKQVHHWTPWGWKKKWVKRTGTASHTDTLTTDLDGKPKGAVFGAHAGYNWQFGKTVVGVEGDFDGADLKTSGALGTQTWNAPRNVFSPIPGTTFDRSIKFDELATLRARLGYLLLPNLLAYGTAGGAWGHSELNWTATNTAGVTGGAFKDSSFGWVAGGGLEYKIWEHVLVRAEYLHYDFGEINYGGIDSKSTIDVVRGGLSYKF